MLCSCFEAVASSKPSYRNVYKEFDQCGWTFFFCFVFGTTIQMPLEQLERERYSTRESGQEQQSIVEETLTQGKGLLSTRTNRTEPGEGKNDNLHQE
jgi:hypothetical protein